MCSFDFEKKKIAYVICFQDEIAVNCEIFVKRSNFNVNVVQCDFPLQFSFLFFFLRKTKFSSRSYRTIHDELKIPFTAIVKDVMELIS